MSHAKIPGLIKAAVVGPPLVLLVVLYVVPAIILFTSSMERVGPDYQLHQTWSLYQYGEVLTDPVVLKLLGRSFLIAFETTAACLVFGFPLAYFIARKVPSRWRALLLVLIIAPSWTSFLIRIYSWILVLGNDGLVNYVANAAGLPGTPYRFLIFDQFSVIVSLTYIYLPFTLLPIYASLEKLDEHQLEAARSLGAPAIRVLRRVVLPLAAPGIMAGCMITFIPTLGEYVAPAILGGRSGYMFGNLISDQFGAFNWPRGAALGIVLLVAALVFVAVFARFVRLRDVWSD